MGAMNDKAAKTFSRRGFIGASLAAAAAAGLRAKDGIAGQAAGAASQPAPSPKPALKIKDYRRLRRTDFKVSDISVGGGPLSNDNVLRAAIPGFS